ncbi:hypothetical protein [Streptomyces chromofuscus]|uniref:hypothetical protein n=1 Tax=Streptomyces chromofuscus TaxID=42881 RepID=UPI00167699D1|nr:hypothetical protein [Streptomyces chromofuscus]GGT03275.1 hypothetical protein GCM10010254_24500 [Streptomyces chromofuscus]
MVTHTTQPHGFTDPASIRQEADRPHDDRKGQESITRRTLRHLATGAAALALLHAALLGGSSGTQPLFAADRLGTAQVMDSVRLLAPWPLTALVLLWLAHQRPAAYARAALALLAFSAAGMAYTCWMPVRYLPAREGSLLGDFLATPGALTGWYLLIAMAVTSALSSSRARVAVATTALSAVATSVLTTDHTGLAITFAAGIPLASWFVAGRLSPRRARSRRPADAWDPEGRAVLRRRTVAPQRIPGPASVPLRQAG